MRGRREAASFLDAEGARDICRQWIVEIVADAAGVAATTFALEIQG
jgi:hypothetical protein